MLGSEIPVHKQFENTMKKGTLAPCLITLGLLMGVGNAHAVVCARGYISLLTEGGFNSSDLHLKMAYTSVTPLNTRYGYLRFRSTLDPARLKAIRSLAYIALFNGNEIEITAHPNALGVEDCTDATQLSLFALPTPQIVSP